MSFSEFLKKKYEAVNKMLKFIGSNPEKSQGGPAG